MSALDPILTMVYSPTAVVSIEPENGKKWPPIGQKATTGTQAQIDALITRLHLTPLPDPALVAARATKLGALQTAYTAALAAGVTVTAGTPAITATFAADVGSQTRLAALLTLWSDAESHAWDDAYAATSGDAPTKTAAAQAATVAFNSQNAGGVVDVHGALIPGTIDQLRRLIVALGTQCAALQFGLQTATAAVNAATTVAAVNAIA